MASVPRCGLLSTYFPPLPRSVLTLQAGGLVNSYGNGFVMPFLLIYLYNVRGIGYAVAGLILATHAVVSIVLEADLRLADRPLRRESGCSRCHSRC